MRIPFATSVYATLNKPAKTVYATMNKAAIIVAWSKVSPAPKLS